MGTFNEGHPWGITVTLTVRERRDATGRVKPQPVATYTLDGCLIDHLNWSVAKGLWDDSETDSLALNIPCPYRYSITTTNGTPLTHEQVLTGSEVRIPEGSPMAGLWVIDSTPACSGDPDLGDVVRLKRA